MDGESLVQELRRAIAEHKARKQLAKSIGLTSKDLASFQADDPEAHY